MKKVFKIISAAFIVAALAVSMASCDIIFSIFGHTVPPMECEHSWVYATCDTPETCCYCSETKGEPLGHDYSEEITAPSCTEDGYTTYTCSLCGDSHTASPTVALGHTESDWIFMIPPGSVDPTARIKECTVCGERLAEESIEAHVHSMSSVEALAPTCTKDGHSAYVYCTVCGYNNRVTLEALGHEWGEWASVGNSTHVRVCSTDPAHTQTEFCSGDGMICDGCGGEYEYSPTAGNSAYGYFALGEYPNGENMQLLYKEMQKTANDFLISNLNVKDDNGYYVIGSYDYTDYSLTADEAMGVWKIFYVDNPSYYWLSSVALTRGDDVLLSIDKLYADASYRRECDTAVAAMIAECAALITEDMTELERAVKITEYIVTNMEYAYEEDGVTPVEAMWAHNIMGLAAHGYGVCESYAKGFMQLCLLNGIDCIMGSGYADGEAHAWNYVSIDGVWYGADITWTDTAADEACYDRFGMSDSLIHADHKLHQSETPCVDFIYTIPTLSNTSIQLVELYKNGEREGLYKSLDEAMGAMTDPTAEYEASLAFYGFFVGATEHDLKLTELPDVKKITISGKNEYAGEEYLDRNSVLLINYAIKLNSDLELKNLDVRGKVDIGLNYNKLTLSGNSVYLGVRINGEFIGNELEILTERHAYLNAPLSIYLITAGERAVVFAADATVYIYSGNAVYTSGNVEVDIKNRV